jgi:hypothetical protein
MLPTLVITVPNLEIFLFCQHNSTIGGNLELRQTIVDRFPLPPVSPPIGDTSLTHVMRFTAHSTTSSVPTAMGRSL